MKKKSNPLSMEKGERVVAAVPEICKGPGWRNWVLWVFIARPTPPHYRQVGIQVEDMSHEILTLFPVCATAHRELMAWAKSKFERKS